MSYSVKLRSKKGVEHLRELSPSLKLLEFLQLAAEKTGYPPLNQKLLVGYPPRAITADLTAPISSFFTNGNIITVEEDVHSPFAQQTEQSREENGRIEEVKPQITRKEGIAATIGDMVRRKMADDNSCLFNAVGYTLEGRSRIKASQLRSLIASLVVADPQTYSEAMLGKETSTYANWIREVKHWGGAIELSILAQHYHTEIAAFAISTKKMYCYGEGQNYLQRVFLVYDGIHYDALALNPLEDGPEEFDITIFSPFDENAKSQAERLVTQFHNEHQYTDMATFQLLCTDCNTKLKGEKEAALHAMTTGHGDFVEMK